MSTDNNPALSALLVVFATLFIFNSPAVSAAKDAPEPNKVLHDFCNQRISTRDKEFCIKALESDPRSAAAKDLVGLVKISVDLAVKNVNITQQFMETLSKNGEGSPELLQAIKECSAQYDWGLKELQIIPRELLDDTALASYDALMASDALKSCKDSLRKRKIRDRSILRRHRIATEYVRLCVDIARKL